MSDAPKTPKTIYLRYFAQLREQSEREQEERVTTAQTYGELYQELKTQYGFTLDLAQIKVAANDMFVALDQPLRPGDEVVFIPPVAGG
ncbi:MAG: molybdopterin synthase sulfur carrier subunit [Thermosynechococcus sp.]|uniref:MoaD/ThiS family protein n=1 Tax=Thermosynechococcus sp. TaxID=2814275 RepID=UPI00220491FA|nr:MoaD/ThiS family protein [Thermosynechococcus sp.]BCX12256.1 MAG: molybdopterin synthase sulfur carrier subunit [Thermosynechococcus sp.]